MKIEPPVNINYAAQVIRIPAVVDLQGLDNLVGVPALGHQALTTRGVALGDLAIAFTAETALDPGYASANNLYRDAGLNSDKDITGYLEQNCRIRALKLRGHVSNALLMPLSSVEFAGVNWLDLREGDTFDQINGKPICKKYEIARKANTSQKSKIERAFKRVDLKMLPEHFDTDNYFRSACKIPQDAEIIVTAKYHGTSIRISNTVVRRKLTWRDRVAQKFGIRVAEYEYDYIHGSRKVIKDPQSVTQQHFYGFDLWTREGEKLRNLLPQGVIVYGELIGWADPDSPIQKGYDYGIPNGESRLLVYRVARIAPDGYLSDLSWDQTKAFCRDRGLAHVPELWRGPHSEFTATDWLETRFQDAGFLDCLPLPNKKLVDEGVVIRIEGVTPALYKAKSPSFLEFETKQLDTGEADLESAA